MEKDQKTAEGIERIGRYRTGRTCKVMRLSVEGEAAEPHPGNRIQRSGVTEEQLKQEKVMERVYEPGRLYEALQQVKGNAGAAGIDKMTVEEFESRETELLGIIHEK